MPAKETLGQLIVLALLAASLAGGWSPRGTGDSREYLAMTLNVLENGAVAIAPYDVSRIEALMAQQGYEVAAPIERVSFADAGGSLHLRHFWLYSLVAAPFVGVALALDLSAAQGFAWCNLLLLLAAAWVMWNRLGPWIALLLCACPIVWWLDKMHVEVFIFALLALGLTTAPRNFVFAMVCLGAATAQYPPLGAVLALVALASWVRWPPTSPRFRWWVGALAGSALAALHPIYYYLNLGVLTPFSQYNQAFKVPSLGELLAVPLDPNIGLLPAFPMLAVAWIVLLARIWRHDRSRDVLLGLAVAVLSMAVLLVAFVQPNNFNNGGTLNMNRWGLWLIPLLIPPALASRKEDLRAAPMVAVAVVSAVLCLNAFHPAIAGEYLRPTRLAEALWQRVPGLYDPLPEIFAERTSGAEPGLLPASNATCNKVLLVEGEFPIPCPPAANAPEECRRPGQLCYASGRPGEYRFSIVPGDLSIARWQANPMTWSRVAPRVLRLLDGVDLENGMEVSAFGDRRPVRSSSGMQSVTGWHAGDHGYLYVYRPGPESRLMLRLPVPVSAWVVTRRGVVLAQSRSPRDPDDPWYLSLPGPHPDLFIVYAAESSQFASRIEAFLSPN